MSIGKVKDLEIYEQRLQFDGLEIIIDFNARFTAVEYLLFMAVVKPKYHQIITFGIMVAGRN